jgi:magnesium transporter
MVERIFMSKDNFTITYLLQLIKDKNVLELREFCESNEPIDIAELAEEIEDPKDLLFIFKTVKSDFTAEVFTYLSSDQQEKLLTLFTDKQLIELINSSYTDDIVDFMIDMPANLVTRILRISDSDTRRDINHLLNYKEDTAGSIMTTEYILLPHSFSVEEALTRIRKVGPDMETIYTSFIVDSKRLLIGIIDIEDLLFADPKALITDIMEKDFITTNVNTDQEEVAQLFKRYDLTVMPVLNDDQRLIGIVTIDDVIDVIEQETSEDIQKMAALNPLDVSYNRSSVAVLAKKSAPWLLVLMVLSVFSSIILNRFEASLEQVVILAAFIPMLMDTGGNAGSQSTTLITRGIALKEIELSDFKRVFLKEMRVSLLVGLAVGLFSFFWISFQIMTGILIYEPGPWPWTWPWIGEVAKLSGLVAITLFSAIVIAKVFGGMLPLIATKLKKDPAVMSGPFVTTIVDVSALIIYFLLSTLFFSII